MLGFSASQTERVIPDREEPLLLEAPQVARLLGIGRTKVYELIERGELPVLRVGRCVRVPRRALEAWIHLQTTIGNSV